MRKKKWMSCEAKNFTDCFKCPWPDCIRGEKMLVGEKNLTKLNPPNNRIISDEYTKDYDTAHIMQRNEGLPVV